MTSAKILSLFPVNAEVVERIHPRDGFSPGGLWEQEPDRVQWRDPETGRVCLIKRNTFGAWCGYVGVEPGHPWHNKGYMEVQADVHGSLTYADHCDEDPAKGICHIPTRGEADNLFWLGFDCGHSFDLLPDARMNWGGGIYRDAEYVRDECRNLARQADQAQ